MTVIVAIQDARDQTEACLRRLTDEQTLPRDRYELVVVGPEEVLREEQVAERLRPGDQLIRHPSPNEFLLYNVAAERARGEVLFVIEAHCIAEPDCLERVLEFLRREGVAGASVRSVPVTGRPFADSEQQMFECAHLLADPKHYFTVLIHGFAIEKAVFELAGGFDHRLGEFSAMALSATLHSLGMRMGYATDAVVRHQYGMSMWEVFKYVRDFTEGEMRFRATEPPERVDLYLDESPEWIERRSFESTVAARLARGLAITRRAGRDGGSWRKRVTLRVQSARLRTRAYVGLRHRIARAYLRVSSRWLSAYLRKGGPREYEAYLAWWEAVISLSRIRFLHGQRRSFTQPPAGSRSWAIAAADERHLVGFHARERWQGRPFRWTSELSAVELDLSPGHYRVRLDLLPIATAGDSPTLLFDDTVVPIDDAGDPWAITFSLKPRMFRSAGRHWLTISADPLPGRTRAEGESRRLALPVCGLAIQPQGPFARLGQAAPPHPAPQHAGENGAIYAEGLVGHQRAGGPGREPADAAR